MRTPNLFIVGAARSGTTSLWQYLKVHPEVYMPEDELQKEPSFFSESGRRRGVKQYLSIFASATDSHKWVGEASVEYLTDPQSAEKIYAFDPSSRIIIILRKPWNRAYSLYNWMVHDGYEYASNFEEALELESLRQRQRDRNWHKPNYYWGYLYCQSGMYYEQIKRYMDLFKENVLLLSFETLVKDPGVIYSEICSFLGIPPFPISYEAHNQSRAVLSPKVVFLLRKLNNHIIKRNKRGVPLSSINRGIGKRYKMFEKKLSKVTELSPYEKELGVQIIKRVSEYLKNINEEYHYAKIQTKAQRDQMLTFGQKPEPPIPMERDTKYNLMKVYADEIERIARHTGIDFREGIEGLY